MAEPARNTPRLLVRGGLLVDELGERRGDMLIEAGRILEVDASIGVTAGTTVLDAEGCVVAPGLVDLHTHLREPGGEVAETVESGARAAALGGYSAIVAMPNTTPAIDSPSVVRDVLHLGERACVEVAVAGAITVGREGTRLAPMGEMAALGVHLFTDDGRGVQHAGLMRRALEYARDLGVTLAQHCEDEELAAGGHMHEGEWSGRLGITGQPALAEEHMLARDLALVALTGAPMHFLHLSTRGSVRLLERAKAEGLPVTAEVTPHHLTLTDAALASYDPVFKVYPPLREAADVAALRRAVAEGVLDAIATDHAPHPTEAKDEPLDVAPPGMIGLETALAVACQALRAEPAAGGEALSWRALFALFSWKPAAIAGLAARHGGPLTAGGVANLCVFDPEARWRVDPAAGASRSRNSPFAGSELRGRVRHTIVSGEAVVVDMVACR